MLLLLLAMCASLDALASIGLQGRDNCAACDPGGGKMTAAPAIGTDDLGKFYESLLVSVRGIQFVPRNLFGDISLQRRAQLAPICCESLWMQAS